MAAVSKPFGVGWKAGRHDSEARHVRVVRLDALRVIRAAAQAATVGGADHQRTLRVAIGAEADARGVGDDVIGGRVHEVGELNLGHRAQAAHRHAHRQAGDPELHHRRIDHPLGAELSQQAVGRAEHPAERANVLAEDDDALVALHLLAQRFAHRFDDRQRAALGRRRLRELGSARCGHARG